MSDCTGKETLTELLSYLRFTEKTRHICDNSIVIPAMMPYITAQFMPRTETDRPKVIRLPARVSTTARPDRGWADG